MKRLVLVSVVGCAVLALLPMLSSGFYSDDLVNSSLKGEIHLQGSSFWAHFIESQLHWIREGDRFRPLHYLQINGFSYLLTDVVMYKAAILTLIVCNLLLFVRMLDRLVGDHHSACFGALLVPIAFQFRLYHDPILSFSGMMQSFTLFVLLSVVAFQGYLRTGRRGYRVASVISYNVVLYSYEVGFALLPLFVILGTASGGDRRMRAAIRNSLPHLVSAAVALAINAIVRAGGTNTAAGYPGTTLSLDPGGVATTFLKQVFAAFPLSYRMCDREHLFRDFQGEGIGVLLLLPVISCAVLSWHLMRRMTAPATSKLFLVGATLSVLPALMVAVSQKYQKELHPGLGYLPVYIQYFGVATLGVWLLLLAQGRLPAALQRVLHAAVCAGLCFLMLRTIESNRAVVDQANVYMHYPRAALVTALEQGILAQVPEGAGLLILDEYAYDPRPGVRSDLRGWPHQYRWKSAALVYQFAGRRLTVMTDPEELKILADRGTSRPSSRPDAYLLTIKSHPNEMRVADGYVTVSRIDGITTDADGVRFKTVPVQATAESR